MDLDILKKLVRLANNNPNEHEANSAARKVCKILEEDGFKSLNRPLSSDHYRGMADFIRDMQRDAVRYQGAWAWEGFGKTQTYKPPEPKPPKEYRCGNCGKQFSDEYKPGSRVTILCGDCGYGNIYEWQMEQEPK